MEVCRAFLGVFWMDYATIYQDRVVFAIKFSFTGATFDAHIYAQMVAIYILTGHIPRESIDSVDCVLYSESA